MDEFKGTEPHLRPAKLEDYDSIMNIDINDDMDYLPHALKNWIKESEEDKTNRENFVYILDNKVVGFVSVYFLGNRTACIKNAIRLEGNLRGKGIGRQMASMLDSKLVTENSGLKSVISAISDAGFKEEEIVNPKHGKQLTVATSHVFCFKYPDLDHFIDKDLQENLKTLDKGEFANKLKDGSFNHLLDNKVIHMNWVPVILDTDEDIEFVTRKNQIVKMAEDNSSLSILTLPFPIAAGIRVGLDIFTKDSTQLKLHLAAQLKELNSSKYHNILTGKDQSDEMKQISLTIVIHPNLVTDFKDISTKLGLEQFRIRRGPQNKDYRRMFVYEKDIVVN